MTTLDIADVARLSGIPVASLRYYEQRGLIASVGRSGLRRLFASEVLERLHLIGLARMAGFSLREIGSVFALRGDRPLERLALQARVDALDETIRQLSALRDGLQHACTCDQADFTRCDDFRAIVDGRIDEPQAVAGAIR
ncbi:MerR family transcriptional regulator [Luteibacter sp.]|uniref:MerR family transcriptional regulator n=1 Tax=Luteibacter sp. TaxID=1886636 RepID=UPI0025B8CF8B|nr:MerR family transcriptional regulator [Luteibacter sp.]